MRCHAAGAKSDRECGAVTQKGVRNLDGHLEVDLRDARDDPRRRTSIYHVGRTALRPDYLTAAEVRGAGGDAAILPDDTAAASLAVDAIGTLHLAGYGGLVSTLSLMQPVAPRIFGIANAAFGPVGGRIVGGELISIYGPHIGPAAPVTSVADASGMMPKSLGGVQVSVNGSPVTLLYVSDSQVNAVTPLYLSGAAVRASASPSPFETIQLDCSTSC